MPPGITRVLFFTTVLLPVAAAAPAGGQTLLEEPALFAPVAGLNTVPDHGDVAVSFLDYRDGGYSIMAVDRASGIEHTLERVFYAEPVVSTFGQRVAWIGYTPAGQPDVYVHDRTTGTTTGITSDPAFQNHPDLAGSALVWQDYRDAGSASTNADIYLHDFTSNVTVPLTTDPGYQDLPRVHDQWVVWQDFRHAGPMLDTAEIYAFHRPTGQERRLTTGSAYRTNPAVWGDLVVWEDYRGGSDGDIYLFDLAANQERLITAHTGHQGQPAVFGTWVLWLDYRNSTLQGDLYGYHLPAQEEYALLVDPAHQDAPHVYDNHVVWQDYRNGRFDLFAGTLTEPAGTAVEEAPSRRGIRLTAAPNPFTHSVHLTLQPLTAGPLELTFYDLLGRIIARRTLPPGTESVTWDGVSDAGPPVAPGVYVAVVRGQHVFQSIILVRHVHDASRR